MGNFLKCIKKKVNACNEDINKNNSNNIYMTFEDYIISKIDDIIENNNNDNISSIEIFQTKCVYSYKIKQ